MAKKKNVRKAKPERVWDVNVPVRVAGYAAWGMGWEEIGEALGAEKELPEWRKNHSPELSRAFREGRRIYREREKAERKMVPPAGVPRHFAKGAGRGRGLTFQDIVYDRLPPDLQAYWDKLSEWQDDPNAVRRLDKMLERGGVNVRKVLFLKALQYHNFKIAPALRFVGIGRGQYDNWRRNDMDFLNMIETMSECKGDFFEDALINQIISGNPHATIFANKTFNKSRGYGEKVEMEVKGQILHSVAVLEEEDLEVIPVEYRKMLLEAIERRTVREVDVKAITSEAEAV